MDLPDNYIIVDDKIKASVRAFKEKTAANFSPLYGFNAADIENMVRDYVPDLLESNGIDAKIVDLAVVGSRSRGLESDSSDLDVVIEFSSDLKEDALFNIIHEEPYVIGNIIIDINPIRKEETGTLGAYLENAEKTIFENHERNNLSDKQEINAELAVSLWAEGFDVYNNGVKLPDYSSEDRDTYDLFSDERNTFHAAKKDVEQNQALEALTDKLDDIDTAARREAREQEEYVPEIEEYAADQAELTKNGESKFEWRVGRNVWQNICDSILSGETEWIHEWLDDSSDYLPYLEEISTAEKELTAYEKQYLKPQTRENPIHFGLLGNGITAYDTSKTDKETNDYPTVAHISDEGNIKYYTDDLNEEDKRLIEQQAAQQKQEFTDNWNKLPIEARYKRVFDGANALSKPQWNVFFADSVGLSEEEIVKKYEHSIIFNDGDFPEAERPLTAYRIGDFYEFYGEDAHISSDLLGLTETSRQGKPMTGFPQHAFEENRRKFAMQGYYLKVGDEREIDKIINTNSQTEKNNTSKTVDDLRVGDLVRSDGAIWRITSIDGDFSINFENTDKTSIMPEQSIFGHWKQQFSKMGFEIVPPAELTVEQLRETNDTAPKPKKERTEAAQEEYGEQLNLFGEPMHEDEAAEKRIIGGVDIEEALKYELIHYGTGFQDGKFRIEQFYREHGNDTTEFAKFLAKEYGTGGHSCEGKVSMSWHDSKGIKLEFKLDNGEKTAVTWSWQKIASRLTTLIENQTYITQKDIDDRIRSAQYYVSHYDTDDIQYQRGMKVLEEYGLLDNAREEQAPDRAAETEQKETVSYSPEKSEAAEPTAEIAEIKNLVQLKRALVVGAEFEITSAFRPEVANQLRKVNYADTTGIYSIRPDAPDDRVTLANNGRGSYLAWGKSADWSFENGSCTAYQKGSEHIPDNVVFTLKVKPRVIEKEHTEEHKQAPEQDNSAPKLNNIVIDLTPRPEREEIPVEKHNYTITNENLGAGGAKTKFAANIAAIKTLKEIEAENRLATPDEQATLAQYVGWGGIAQAFDENNTQWANEYKQLRELLTDEEYAAAKGSVLNAHYTTPTVINAIYKGLENLGFEGGNILEPAMGVGNFFGVMPEEMRQNSHLHGVELDSISGRIARQLYQTADIQIKGFEKTEFSDNFFDAAIGNVPFGSYGVSDKRYNRENFFIHDYFLAKTLDKLAPGGVAALITTKGTMDKENPKVREYLARRGDLIGAIRLPNTAFKANAGTEVTTDILFFQKREKMAVEMPDWCYIGKNSDGVPVNSYFLDHPEMILGEMKQGVEFSLYGNASETACVPIEGADLKEQLEAAVATLKLNNALRKHTEQREKEAGIIPATADVRNFTFAEVDGKMYFRENNIMTEVTETGKRLDRIKALNELRGTFRGMLSAQEENCSDEQLAALQAKLNTQYDRFVKEYGYINDSANGQIFGKDDDYNSLCALEIIDEENKTVNKSDFFTKRTVKYTAEITHVDTPQEAMQVSIDTRGKMDIPYMAQLCGQEPQQVIDVLKADNLIFRNPARATDNPLDGWEEMSEYLSGDVRSKLRTAEAFAADNPEYQRNVAALTSVLPPKLEAGDISARIGVSWVDVEDYQQFLTEYAKARFIGESMRRTITGEYKIEGKTWDTSAPAIQIYGTSRMPAKAIFENLLNNRDIVVRDKITDPDGREHYEINKKETDLAQEKARQMKDAFKRWLWETPERRDKYVERYNNLFNCIVGRKFDGSHQTFPGMSPSISLKPHQLDAVMRAKFGGNTLLAHCVGAGKSFEMVAATMEKKRLGLINKACVVVPKHLVGQMANEWLRLYPQAKILTATEKDFDKNHRQKFIGRCCTGDYDAVIMSYEQFEKIPMSLEYRQNFIQREIDTMQSGIDDLSTDTRSRANNRSSIKDLEREKKRLEARLEKLIEGGGKTKDTSLTFEQLGFDSLVVDEAHNYKNGLVVSKMNRVSGVQTTPAQKSEDILMKTMFLNENYGEKNIIFATGTPVSNSMTELYIMQRYLRPSLLENAGLQTFDDWASNFGEVVSKAELKPAGDERT